MRINYDEEISRKRKLGQYPYDGIPIKVFRKAYDHYWGPRIFWGTLLTLGGCAILGYVIGRLIFSKLGETLWKLLA